MEGSSATIFSLLMILAGALMPISSANVFYAGGKDGWVLKPSEGYSSWSGRNRFQVNDSLVFKYKKGDNSVLLVKKEDYESCNVKNPLQKLDGGDSIFKFDRSGPFYFISGELGLCSNGQKLIVVVLAVRNTKPIPPPISPPATSEPPTSSPVPSPAVKGPSPSPSTDHSSPSTSPSASPISSPPSPSPAVNAPSPSLTSPSASPISSPPSPSPAVNVPSPSSSSILPPSPSPSTPQSSPALSPFQSPSASPAVSGPSPFDGSLQPPSSSSPPTNGPGSGFSSVPPGVSPSTNSPPSSSTVLTVSSSVIIGVVALVLGGAFLC